MVKKKSPKDKKLDQLDRRFQEDGTLSSEDIQYLLNRTRSSDVQADALRRKDRKAHFGFQNRDREILKLKRLIDWCRADKASHYNAKELSEIMNRMNDVLAWYRKPSKYWVGDDGKIPVMEDGGEQAKEVTAELMRWLKSLGMKHWARAVADEKQLLELWEDEQADDQYDFTQE